MKKHHLYMQECIALAKQAFRDGNPPVGAIVVLEDKIVGVGKEQTKSFKDITKHAEIEAVKDALKNGLVTLKGCTLYTTHEPCIMCSYVLRHYKIDRLVYGLSVDHIGGVTSTFNVMGTDNVLNWGHPPITISGVLEEECASL